MKGLFPVKNTEDSVEKELEYCKELIDVIKKDEKICGYPKVQEKLNLLEETVRDDIERIETSKDEDAKTGHKTAGTSFFGYKTHIAMTEESIITAAAITSGEKTDGKELPALVRKSRDAGARKMDLNPIKTPVCTNARQGIWQSINILTSVKKRKRIKIQGWYIFLM